MPGPVVCPAPTRRCPVRCPWAARPHAKAINHIVEFLEKEDDPEGKRALGELIPKLNESLGHRIREAVCGAALGFVIAIIAHLIRQGGAKLF